MKEQIRQRLQELQTEFESGQAVMAELEAKQANLRDTLLRISGAIQVLKEELTKVEPETQTPAFSPEDAGNGRPPENAPSLDSVR
jgi:predicted nuclease with TOPRIM domain